MSGDLRVRVLSGAGIGLVVIATGLVGGFAWAGLVLLVAVGAAVEAEALLRSSGLRTRRFWVVGAAVVAFGLAWLRPNPAITGASLSAVVFVSLAWQMRDRAGLPIADWSSGLLTGAYIGGAAGHLAALRDAPDGLAWVFVAVGATWLADSVAYLVGRRFGRARLAPSLSPKKSWEGYWAGVGAAAVAGVLAGLALPELGPVRACIAAAGAGFLGTLGDLVESMYKRQAGAKDSGSLIPGHGGLFDRVDSLLWAGVVVYYVRLLLG